MYYQPADQAPNSSLYGALAIRSSLLRMSVVYYSQLQRVSNEYNTEWKHH